MVRSEVVPVSLYCTRRQKVMLRLSLLTWKLILNKMMT